MPHAAGMRLIWRRRFCRSCPVPLVENFEMPRAASALPAPTPRPVRNLATRSALVLRPWLKEDDMGRGLLLWLIGIPLPIILLIWLLGGLHG